MALLIVDEYYKTELTANIVVTVSPMPSVSKAQVSSGEQSFETSCEFLVSRFVVKGVTILY